jgi:DAK2 domain fusion protein YloV
VTELAAARDGARAALGALEANRGRIDDLNVYPVPDGDTGTNLTLTTRSIGESLDELEDGEVTRSALARELTRAALMGARGNSGVILSQIVRGAAEVLGESRRLDAPTLAGAFRGASDAAYRAVRRPVEGTMLTVIREMAEEAEEQASEDPATAELLKAIVRRGEDAVVRTEGMLDVLREAGVVDAGGAGLLEIVRGLAAWAAGEPLPEPAPHEELGVDAIHQELSRYRYCTVFLVEGEELDADALERQLDALGDSLLVVGDPRALRVHLHTDEPGAALNAGTAVGVLGNVEIANMQAQTEQRERRLLEAVPDAPPNEADIVAVVAGDGNRRLFESLGATRIVEGGQTMNPSTAELVAAIDSVPADEVIVLPNNSNVILAAEQAAGLAGKSVEVVRTDSLQAGLAAMVLYDGTRSAAENAAGMRDALDGLATGEVTVASRDAELNGVAVQKGNYFGLVDGEAVAGGDDFETVANAVVERLLSEPRDVLTLLTGQDEPELDGVLERITAAYPQIEVDVQAGGQPHYPLLLSAE